MHLDGWTLLLQTINVLVLLALLRWLFYRPLLAVIDARRQAADTALAQTTQARADAERQAQALQAERDALKATRAQWEAQAHQAASAERDAALQQARQAADALLADAQRQITRERQDASHALEDEAATLATALAARLLAITPAGPGDTGFVDALLARIEATAPEARAHWFSLDAPKAATLATARPLDDGTWQRVMSQLARLLGDDVQLTPLVDPALLAGAELRCPHGELALHWAGELAAARAALRQDPTA